MKKIFQSITILLFVGTIGNAQNTSPYWSLAGNSNATSSSKLGTTNGINLRIFTNNAERIRVTTSGLVGINTTAPNSRLHINSTTGQNPLRCQVNGATKFFVDDLGGVSIGSTLTPPVNGLYVAGTAQFNGIVGIHGAVNTSYALTVNANASLQGIQVTDPVHGYALSCIKSGIGTGIYIEKSNVSSGTPCIEGNSTGSSPGLGGFSITGRGVEGVSSQGDGVYGETSSTSNTAAYAGRFIGNNYRGIFVQGAAGQVAGYFNGSVFTTGTYLGSDAKLKKNVEDLSDAMTIINKLRPKHYEFRNDGNYALMNLPKGNHYGLLAQDVEKVLPEMVKEMGFNTKTAKAMKRVVMEGGKEITRGGEEEKGENVEFKAINYTEFTPIIIKALQEQNDLIKAQSAKIDALTKELDQLKQEVLQNKPVTTPTDAVALSQAFIRQNSPNPFNTNTIINYYIPGNAGIAQIKIMDVKGSLIKSFTASKGEGQLNIKRGELPAGTYNYTLYINDKKIDTKQMVLLK